MKFFNFKFLKEEIKSKRGLILGFLALIPILNFAYLLILALNKQSGIIYFTSLSRISLIGQFLIPVCLAFGLFGFVLKKKSVDFYLAKPIDRRSIYITNTFGGIILIILTLLITCLIFYFFNLLTSLVIPFKLILDYFLYFSISYILVFSISLLALAISGNFISTILVILIIILMYPFYTLTSSYLKQEANKGYLIYNINNSKDIVRFEENTFKNYHYNTLINPFMDYNYYNLTNDDTFYSTKAIIKSTVLSMIYLSLGYYLFLKRKMEDNEYSFKNNKVYYIVKLGTFIPVCLITYALFKASNLGVVVCAILGSFTYYLIYDLIMQRGNVKIKNTLLTFGLFFGLILAFYAIAEKTFYLKSNKNITNLNEVTLLKYDNGQTYQNVVIKNQELINNILKESLKVGSIYASDYRLEVKYQNKYYYAYVNIDDIKPIDNYLKNHHILSEEEKYEFNKTSYLTFNTIPLKINITNSLIKTLEENKDVEENLGIDYELYYYDKHSYHLLTVPIEANLKEAKKILNEDYLKNGDSKSVNIYLNTPNDDYNENEFANFLINRYVINKNASLIDQYLKEHLDEEIKDYSKAITVSAYNLKLGRSALFIADGPSFIECWHKWNKDLENDSEYIYYQEVYNDDIYYK